MLQRDLSSSYCAIVIIQNIYRGWMAWMASSGKNGGTTLIFF